MKYSAAFLMALSTLSWTSLASDEPIADMAEKVLPSVVNISSTSVSQYQVQGMDSFFQYWGIPQTRKQSTLGTGFIIDAAQGHALTNHHVVANATEVVLTLYNNKQYTARVIGSDPKLDVALLRIQDEKGRVPSGLIAAKIGDADKLRIGQTAVAIGNPFGLQHTVTRGIISARHRTIGVGPFDNFIQTDASINPGNSGGPLFNLQGEVIGINTVIFSKTGQWGGLGFAIPINSATEIVPDLLKYGRIPRPWLGILAERVTPQLAAYYRLHRKDGVVIYEMDEEAPAFAAGIRPGDIIIQIDGAPTKELFDVQRILGRLKPRQEVKVTVQRKAQDKTFNVKLTELPSKLANAQEGIL